METDDEADGARANDRSGCPTCFVVMPFGTKPRPEDGRPHDFDKIYRVIIRRAVEQAGMTCIRADETTGSRLIHADMFLDLRDRPLVIVDLSLLNANVFYELGVRHVMSRSGTVLMCETGSMPLPFDIGLSRVVTYDYDGRSIDWEEAEQLVERLSAALIESAAGLPDSPVHAMLQRVLSDDEPLAAAASWNDPSGLGLEAEDLDPYERIVAAAWAGGTTSVAELFEAHGRSIFGCRALGHHVVGSEPFDAAHVRLVARQLADLGEADLAAELLDAIRHRGQADDLDLIGLANAHSESHPDLDGADRALELVAEARELIDVRYPEDPRSREAIFKRAHVRRREAGLRQWRWQLSRAPHDLDLAIAAHGESIQLLEHARSLGHSDLSSLLAQSRLKRMLLFRIRSDGAGPPDPEDDLPAILALRPVPGAEPKTLSCLRWYQSIALADSGVDQVRQRSLEAFAKDADLMQDPANVEIGRRQYTQLRRFLEEYATWLRHPELTGVIGQTLQVRR